MNILDFYRQFMEPEDLVFDIGANTGQRTEIFARLARRVVAVEPVDASFAKLEERASRNVMPVHAAVMGYNGTGTICTSSHVPTIGISSMSGRWMTATRETGRFGSVDHWDRFKLVKTVTLDKLIDKYGLPTFIKIDVEGSELDVLSGLHYAPEALSLEFHPEFLLDAFSCIDHCIDMGMDEFSLSIAETFELEPWKSAGLIKERLLEFTGNVVYGDVYARRA